MSIQKKLLAVSAALFMVFGILTAQDTKKDKTIPASGRQTTSTPMSVGGQALAEQGDSHGGQAGTNVRQDSVKDPERPLKKKNVKDGMRTTTAGKNGKTPAEPDAEEGKVMVDVASSEDENFTGSRFRQRPEGDLQRIEPGRANISAYFGPLKGVLLDSGRNIFVFENDAGELTLVHVSITKNNDIICKTVGQIHRSMEQ